MDNQLLIIRHLQKTFGKSTTALFDLNMSIPKAGIFGFVGPNGAGKSTTINIIANLLRRTSGEIIFLGNPINEKSWEYKRKVGFVLEHPTYIEKLSIKEYLNFAGSMYEMNEEIAKQRTNELITFFEMEEKQDEWIETYSSGMKKKVSLAAALIHDPEFLVLDEPFEGMDVMTIKKTKQLFLDLKNKGKTILITSHILSYVESICDNVAIINKGKIVYQNTTENIRNGFKEKMKEDPKLSALEEIFMSVVDENNESNQTLSWI